MNPVASGFVDLDDHPYLAYPSDQHHHRYQKWVFEVVKSLVSSVFVDQSQVRGRVRWCHLDLDFALLVENPSSLRERGK